MKVTAPPRKITVFVAEMTGCNARTIRRAAYVIGSARERLRLFAELIRPAGNKSRFARELTGFGGKFAGLGGDLTGIIGNIARLTGKSTGPVANLKGVPAHPTHRVAQLTRRTAEVTCGSLQRIGMRRELTGIVAEPTSASAKTSRLRAEATGSAPERTGIFAEGTGFLAKAAGILPEVTGMFAKLTRLVAEATGIFVEAAGRCAACTCSSAALTADFGESIRLSAGVTGASACAVRVSTGQTRRVAKTAALGACSSGCVTETARLLTKRAGGFASLIGFLREELAASRDGSVHVHAPCVHLCRMRRSFAPAVMLSLAACLSAGAQSPLRITRVLADPVAVPDERGEWVEIANAGPRAASLLGYHLASGGDAGFTIAVPLSVPAGGRVRLGRSTDRATNGDADVALAWTGITLGNRADWVALRDPRGATVDSVAWTRAPRGVPIVGHELAAPAAGAPVPADTVRAADSTPKPAAPASTPAPARGVTPRELVVRVLDVGQGDAILIQNGGSSVLVDGGPNPAALGHHLDALGLNGTTIDAVILTHAHADHYQGLREVFAARRGITVRWFWENQDASPNRTLARLRDAVAARVPGGLVYRDTDDPCATGQPLCVLTFKGGAHIEILRPDPLGQGPNNRSPAIKLVGPDSASFTMWMAGDAEQEELDFFERTGYARNPGMQVDVLKADHHGSCNGVSDRYLDLLRPKLAVVSVGAVNDYGHMHEQAKAAYARHHVPWYRTDQNGTITLRSPGVPGGGYTVSVERGSASLAGPSDRRSTQAGCAGM